jgi:hypothetical protein
MVFIPIKGFSRGSHHVLESSENLVISAADTEENVRTSSIGATATCTHRSLEAEDAGAIHEDSCLDRVTEVDDLVLSRSKKSFLHLDRRCMVSYEF